MVDEKIMIGQCVNHFLCEKKRCMIYYIVATHSTQSICDNRDSLCPE